MTEHKICEDCRWNKYPECEGTLIKGITMKIDNLNISFQCGQKERDVIDEVMPLPEKTKVELLEDRIKVLEDVKKG